MRLHWVGIDLLGAGANKIAMAGPKGQKQINMLGPKLIIQPGHTVLANGMHQGIGQ